ncbi:hypothetical protein BH24CHL5_BH24CHL5_03930 [soil metagenome]
MPERTELVTRRGRRRLWVLGTALAGYGVIGIVLFAVVALSIARPLERARRLSSSVEVQRAELVTALEQAETTIGSMAEGVGRMDTSLSQAKAATDRAAGISRGVASSMLQLRDAVSLTIFNTQPLIGLAGGFESSGRQLQLLGEDMTNIGAALDSNRADIAATTTNLTLLATAVGELRIAVRDGPGVEISAATLDAVRMAIYAVATWMVLLAVGCVAGGIYMIGLARRPITA